MIKHLLSLIFCVSSLKQVEAQYLDFPDTGALWNVHTAYYDGNPPSHPYNYYYYSNGKIGIGNNTYTRIAGRAENWFPLIPPDHGVYDIAEKYVRTDTAAGKVFWLNGSNEELLFDYTLQVGDTLTGCPIIIDSVFTTFLFGKNRKVFRYGSFQSDNGYIIEGIGSTNGIFVTKPYEQYSCFEWVCALSCFSLNGEALNSDLTTHLGYCLFPDITPPDTSCHAYFELYPDSSTAGTYWGYNLSSSSSSSFLMYAWDFGDDSTSTQAFPSHTYSQPGQYNVCLTVSNIWGCSSTYCDTSYIVFKTEGGLMNQLNILNPSGIEEVSFCNSCFSLSPNPATTQTTITIPASMVGSTLTVTDLTGRKISDIRLLTQHSTLQTQHLPNCVYLLTLNEAGASVTKKLVIGR